MNRKQKACKHAEVVKEKVRTKARYLKTYEYCVARETYLPNNLSRRDRNLYMGEITRVFDELVHEKILFKPQIQTDRFFTAEFVPKFWYFRRQKISN